MTINKLNYEVYAIDYLDGNLTGELLEEMEHFMLMNPEIAKEVGMFNSMAFVSDTSIEYVGKSDMKKPIQFSILNYMNWIVPICMSITFMAVYPYIREYWITGNDLHPSSQPVKEVPYTQPEENTVQLDKAIPISSVLNFNKRPSSQVSSVPINSFIQKSTTRNRNLVAVNFKQENTSIPERMNSKSNIVSENDNWNEQEKSTVDFLGKKVLNVDNQTGLVINEEIAMYPNEFETIYDLEAYNDRKFNGVGKPIPYLTLSFTPFGIGHDIAKTTNIATEQLVRDLTIDENSDIVLSAPIHVGIGTALHLSEIFSIETGYYAIKRNLTYFLFNTGSTEKIKTNIRYINHSVPVNAVLALPFFNNSLNVRVGAAVNWMGSRNYTFHEEGNLTDEVEGTATIIETPNSKLVTTNDNLKFVPSMQLGFEYDKDINYGNIAFALTYNRQMGNINDINVWDYSLARNNRIGEPQTFNMRYETVTASVKYTLPNRWYLNKK